ncbi:hypothetical protein [Solemya velesiana gill symbiont]|uniref:Uncharacterized protein n=1 Tax=Solemya velesiana gill symbiont TaxID=1918948 RepID=A0A1T2KU65_9GAMM|nr:hypothetical protein [Solemya velesiana gill symbiont]OOZ36395.1 hypothetical protein BOW51_07360 [Solemya velesiana gill symbiont]
MSAFDRITETNRYQIPDTKESETWETSTTLRERHDKDMELQIADAGNPNNRYPFHNPSNGSLEPVQTNIPI